MLGRSIEPPVVHHLLLLEFLTYRVALIYADKERISNGALLHTTRTTHAEGSSDEPRTTTDLDLSFFWLFHLGSVPPPTLPPALSHTPLIEKKSNSVSQNLKIGWLVGRSAVPDGYVVAQARLDRPSERRALLSRAENDAQLVSLVCEPTNDTHDTR